jgi:hypothetical protein
LERKRNSTRQFLPEGDKVQLQQVVRTSVMNAIEAMQSVHYRAKKVKSEQSKLKMVHVSIKILTGLINLT